MRGALAVTLIVLALLVAAFTVTWLTIPAAVPGTTFAYSFDISPPARWFVGGLEEPEAGHVELRELKERIVIVFGAAAVVVILLGVAFGAVRRPRRDTSE